MMLATNVLAAAAAVSVAIFSPSSGRATCKKQVAPSRFRYEPYSARVLTSFSNFAVAASPMLCEVRSVEPIGLTSPVKSNAAIHVTPSTVSPVVVVPAKSVAAVAATRYAIVQFKHESATFVAPFKIAAGDLVVVEGDRGENIGVVAEITKQMPSYEVPNKVLRRATEQDRQALSVQREREASATMATRALAESIGLHGRIEDAEYQFDMNKLTIFVRRPSKGTFIDFRKLQRGLFREFRCRIWCAYMDEVEASEAAPRAR